MQILLFVRQDIHYLKGWVKMPDLDPNNHFLNEVCLEKNMFIQIYFCLASGLNIAWVALIYDLYTKRIMRNEDKFIFLDLLVIYNTICRWILLSGLGVEIQCYDAFIFAWRTGRFLFNLMQFELQDPQNLILAFETFRYLKYVYCWHAIQIKNEVLWIDSS